MKLGDESNATDALYEKVALLDHSEDGEDSNGHILGEGLLSNVTPDGTEVRRHISAGPKNINTFGTFQMTHDACHFASSCM